MIGKFVSIIFLIVGFSFILTSVIIMVTDSNKKKSCTQKVYATITSLNRIERKEIDRKIRYISYYPVYQYEYMGETYERESNVGGKEESFTIGATRSIFINPKDPTEIREDSNVVTILKYLFLGIGFVCLVVGGIILVLF